MYNSVHRLGEIALASATEKERAAMESLEFMNWIQFL